MRYAALDFEIASLIFWWTRGNFSAEMIFLWLQTDICLNVRNTRTRYLNGSSDDVCAFWTCWIYSVVFDYIFTNVVKKNFEGSSHALNMIASLKLNSVTISGVSTSWRHFAIDYTNFFDPEMHDWTRFARNEWDKTKFKLRRW